MKRWKVAGMLAALVIGTMAAGIGEARAQDGKAAPAAAAAVDVGSVDGIIAALYGVISGNAGQPRDWNRMRSLFAPEGRLVAVGVKPDGSSRTVTMTVDDYIARNTRTFQEIGFFETELARTSEGFGRIVHVFSTYESRHAPGDAKPFQRGINSIQLYNDGTRWWVLNLLWHAETEKQALPQRYLSSH